MNAEQAYLFRHALLRDAAYQLQLPGDRARLHLLALEILEAHCVVDENSRHALALELADHAAAAAEAPMADKAKLRQSELAWLLLALEHADRSFRHEERRALGLRVEAHPSADASCRVKALVHVSRALHRLGRMNDALATSQRALTHAEGSPDQSDLPAALIALQSDFSSCGRDEEARVALRKALELARRGSDRVYIDALLMHVQFLQQERQFEAARRVIEELEPLLVRLPTAAAKARLHYIRAMQQLETAEHDLSKALQFAQGARKALQDLGQRDIETLLAFNIGVSFANRAMPAETKFWYQEALRLSHEIGSRSIAVSLLYNLGNLAYYMEYRYLEAIDIYNRGLADALESGQLHLAQSILANLGAVLLVLGRLDEAEVALLRAKELSSKSGVPGETHWLDDTLAELFIERGDLAHGEHILRERLRNARAHREIEQISSTLKDLAAVWTRIGMLGMAWGAFAESIQCAEQILWPTYAVQSLAARSAQALLLGDSSQAALDDAALEKLAQKSTLGRVRLVAVVMPGFRKAAYDASVTSDPPSEGMVEKLTELAAEFDRSAELGDSRLSVRFRKSSEDIAGIVSEVIRAKEARQPAQLFNGTQPEKLTPQLRLALIDRMSTTQQEQFARLKQERPGVLARMLEGTEGLPLPNWRETALPSR